MKQTINILTEKVINQIAAGEVIQRPSSVVKELLENSIDAKAKNIHLIIKKSGKSLIKIIDDGIGMNKQDAEICFLKHSTSKIEYTQDITSINTMGFRGEALASIASIAEVELKTKTKTQDTGILIHIDNSEIKKNIEIAMKTGTYIAVKNLFFNIPARKKFLKSDQIENKHILDTFSQIAIAHPHVGFKLINNELDIYDLKKTNLKQRIIDVFGKRYNKKILPIQEKTSIVNITGFIGNPIDAKKTRGEQFLYINNRYVKSAYLNHSIKQSMIDMIKLDYHPSYFIFLSISPSLVDVNIHPNKTEVKFEDEKSIYQILKSTCKRSIGIHNITPSLDFSTESGFEIPIPIPNIKHSEPKIKINSNYNPFNDKNNNQNTIDTLFTESNNTIKESSNGFTIKDIINIDKIYALLKITINDSNSINIIHKKHALQRIIYEENKNLLKNKTYKPQKLIEPVNVMLNKADLELIQDNKNIIQKYGYHISKISQDSIEFDACPQNITNHEIITFIETLLEGIKDINPNIDDIIISLIAKKITLNQSIQDALDSFEDTRALHVMIEKLLECENPFMSIHTSPCLVSIEPNNFFE